MAHILFRLSRRSQANGARKPKTSKEGTEPTGQLLRIFSVISDQ